MRNACVPNINQYYHLYSREVIINAHLTGLLLMQCFCFQKLYTPSFRLLSVTLWRERKRTNRNVTRTYWNIIIISYKHTYIIRNIVALMLLFLMASNTIYPARVYTRCAYIPPYISRACVVIRPIRIKIKKHTQEHIVAAFN